MAAYIAFVACYPCNDADICVDVKVKGTEQAMVSAHEHSQEEIDLCSPFCICNCCTSTITQPKYFSFVFYFPKGTEFNETLTPYNVKAVSYSIWQPPRIV